MHARLFGPAPHHPVLAAIGVFDPFTHLHADLMQTLALDARDRQMTSLAILFEPDLRALLYGASRWPVIDDAATRRQLIASSGVDAVLEIACDASDLESGAREVFDLACDMVPLAELWLGHRQRLGSGDPGSDETIRREAFRRGVQITRLPSVAIHGPMDDLRTLIYQGQIAAVTSLLGRHPQRVRSATLEVAWAAGTYTALGHDDHGQTTLLDLDFIGEPGTISVGSWPDVRFSRLSLLSGPGDVANTLVAAADQILER